MPTKTQNHIDQNNVFSSPHWFADSIDDNHLCYMESGDYNGNNSIHVKTNNLLGLKSAEFAGEPFIQYNDMVKHGNQSTEDFLDNFTNYLKANGVDALNLHNVREDSHIFDYCYQNGYIIARKKAAWLDFKPYVDFDDYLKSIGKNTRYKYNRLARQHDVTFEIYKDHQITAEIVTQVIEQKSKQLELRNETSRLFANKNKLDNLVKKLTTPCDDFETYVTLLKVDGVLASSTVVFIKNEKIHLYILAMDDDQSKFSPGNHIILENIRMGFDLGCVAYDFLSPEDAYKLKWSNDNYTPVYDILLPITAKGKIFGLTYLKTVRPILKCIYLSVKKSGIFKFLQG